MTETIGFIFGSLAMSLAGGSPMLLALILLCVLGALMFVLKVPMAFAFPAGIMLLFILSYVDPLFLVLSQISLGLIGIVFVMALFRRTGS